VDGIAPVWFDGTDGTHAWGNWWHVSQSKGCFFYIQGDGLVLASDASVRCLPEATYPGGGGWADENCTMPSETFKGAPCPEWGVGWHDTTGCPYTRQVRVLGPRIDRHYSRVPSTLMCVPATDAMPPEFLSYRWDELPPAAMPAGHLSPPQGMGRIQSLWMTTSAGSSFVEAWDATLKQPCRPSNFPDGTVRCVPRGAVLVADEFADSGCSESLATTQHVWTPERTCESPSYAIRRSLGRDLVMIPSSAVYEVGAAFIGTVFQREGSNCVAKFSAEPTGGNRRWQLGALVPPERLARLTRILK
jgi:hypothetical protein